ncbi:MAG TPA: NnrS family protein, partial [Arenibaculum sp.]|nr:NnrS family protein [Arenibaculum sp.]
MAATTLSGPGPARFAPFAYGFRPFFLIAGLLAAVLVPVWLMVLVGGPTPAFGVPPAGWHGHEMMFGFVGAAIGGFMLTAIPSWTGARPVTGATLAGLVTLFVAGRIASLPAFAASPVAAAIDLTFFPALGLVMALPLIRAGKARNMAFLGLLALLTAANLLMRLEWAEMT